MSHRERDDPALRLVPCSDPRDSRQLVAEQEQERSWLAAARDRVHMANQLRQSPERLLLVFLRIRDGASPTPNTQLLWTVVARALVSARGNSQREQVAAGVLLLGKRGNHAEEFVDGQELR